MQIQKYEKFKLNINRYTFLYSKMINPSYISLFFFDMFWYIQKIGLTDFIKNLDCFYPGDIETFLVELNVDHEVNLFYFTEPSSEYNAINYNDPDLDKSMENIYPIQLCKKDLIKYSVITKENFIHLLMTWEKYLEKKIPYLLLYQDNTNWYDLMPFETQEAMDKFVADHTEQIS